MTESHPFSHLPHRHPLLYRLVVGLVSGMAAAAVMLVLMTLADVTGLFPIPGPPAVALVDTFTGFVLPPIRLHVLGVALHLAYGGIWAAAMMLVVERVRWWHPLLLALVLWILAQPGPMMLIGWGPFGLTLSPFTPIATLLYHAVYGSTLAWFLSRLLRPRPERSA